MITVHSVMTGIPWRSYWHNAPLGMQWFGNLKEKKSPSKLSLMFKNIMNYDDLSMQVIEN